MALCLVPSMAFAVRVKSALAADPAPAAAPADSVAPAMSAPAASTSAPVSPIATVTALPEEKKAEERPYKLIAQLSQSVGLGTFFPLSCREKTGSYSSPRTARRTSRPIAETP